MKAPDVHSHRRLMLAAAVTVLVAVVGVVGAVAVVVPSPGPPRGAVTGALGPGACTVERLPLPADPAPDEDPGRKRAEVTGVDPTGHHLIGQADFRLPLLWTDGALVDLGKPDDDEFVVTVAVNQAGAVVGTTRPLVKVGEQAEPTVTWSSAGGTYTELPGGDTALPVAIGADGTVLAYRPVGDDKHVPVVWRSPTSEPEQLAMPDGIEYAEPLGIDEDGTIVAAVESSSEPPMSRLLVWKPGESKPGFARTPGKLHVSTLYHGFRGGWITVETSTEVRVWNYREDSVVKTYTSRNAYRAATPNANGWVPATVDDRPTVWLPGGGFFPLPELDRSSENAPLVISDDGHTIGGRAGPPRDPNGAISWIGGPYTPVMWHCQ